MKIMGQKGRSMVEMLGVLAIVGVLSVGAIAGYSKAMMKYKLNKHTVAINSLINTAIQYTNKLTSVDDEKDSYGTIDYTATFHKARLTPDDITFNSQQEHLIDMFDNHIWLFQATSLSYSGMGYSFTSDDINLQVCRNLINILKGNSSQIYYIYTDQRDQDNNLVQQDRVYGDKYCTDNCLRNISLDEIERLCHSCQSNCRFYVTWQ